jgi:hypothetical protein
MNLIQLFKKKNLLTYPLNIDPDLCIAVHAHKNSNAKKARTSGIKKSEKTEFEVQDSSSFC